MPAGFAWAFRMHADAQRTCSLIVTSTRFGVLGSATCTALRFERPGRLLGALRDSGGLGPGVPLLDMALARCRCQLLPLAAQHRCA